MKIINNKEDMEGMIEKLEESNLIEDVYTLTKAYLTKKGTIQQTSEVSSESEASITQDLTKSKSNKRKRK